MKKIIIAILILIISLSFVACNNKKENTNMKYEEGIFYDKNWNEEIGTYTNNIVSTKEDAINIAVSIYNGMKKSKEMSNLVPNSVFYDTQDEIWIINFKNPNSRKTVGGDCNIALQKKDGKVLRIWFGE